MVVTRVAVTTKVVVMVGILVAVQQDKYIVMHKRTPRMACSIQHAPRLEKLQVSPNYNQRQL